MAVGLYGDEEPRRGVSRANSVRFDESANHGYYGQPGRSTSELPVRTGSGMGSHPLSERSLSHRSEGRQSSSGLSLYSTRTNSLETTSRMMSSSFSGGGGGSGGGALSSGSPFIPPPGLFLLGPVPSIIRCWLTTNFSNDSLQYAAVCSGSYSSSISYSMLRKFDLEGLVDHEEEGVDRIKLPLYLPEASVHQSSSRASSPVPQLPALTVRFIAREVDPRGGSIQIILGSDVLRSHNADVLFSLDKVTMVDDERNKVLVPLVRPENDSAFSSLCTVPEPSRSEGIMSSSYYLSREAQTYDYQANNSNDVDPNDNINNSQGATTAGVIGQPLTMPAKQHMAEATGTSTPESDREGPREVYSRQNQASGPSSTNAEFHHSGSGAAATAAGVWGSSRRNSRTDSSATATAKSHGRTMKVLRPSKPPQNRINTSSSASSPLSPLSTESAMGLRPSSPQQQSALRVPTTSDESKVNNRQWTSNPIGEASAFGWLNSAQQPRRTVTNPEFK